MSEEEIKELEEFLLPYVNDRLDKWYIATKIGECFMWVARALIRCLLNVTEKIHLLEITSLSLSEVYFIEKINIFQNKDGAISSFMEMNPHKISGEIHQWIIYLQENGKLSGIYERHTGFYRNK